MTQIPEVRYAPDTAALTPAQSKSLYKAIGGSALGNAVEWFEFAVYAYVAVYIAPNFFPADDRVTGLLSTFAVLAASFLIRPLGGMILGPLGDRVGRQKVLILTIIMMTLATFMIGLLPTYAAVGILAPVMLIACRLIQGFSAGGEYGGAAVFIAESAPDNRRGFFGSFLEIGTMTGSVAGAALCTLLNMGIGDEAMEAWGWRIPFLATLPLGLVALWMRTRIQESEVFTEMREESVESASKKRNTASTLKETLGYWRRLLILIGFVLLMNIAYYTVLSFLPSYLSTTLGHSTSQSNFTLVIIMLIMTVLLAPLGALSDRIGRKPLLIAACVGFFILPIPLFHLITTSGIVGQSIGLLGLGLLLVTMTASVSSTLPALFPTQVRYSGFALGYNVSTSAFGGTAPFILTLLISITGSDMVPAWYLMAAAAIAFIPICLMPETAGRSLRGTQCPGDNDDELAAQGIALIGYKSK